MKLEHKKMVLKALMQAKSSIEDQPEVMSELGYLIGLIAADIYREGQDNE